MAVLVRPRAWGQTKPPAGSTVNAGHPLAQGLVACVLGNDGRRPTDIVRNLTLSPGTTNEQFGVGPRGDTLTARSSGGTPSGWSYPSSKNEWLPTTSVTILLGKRKLDATNRGVQAVMFSSSTSIIELYLPFSDGTVYWDWGNSSGSNRLTYASGTMGDDLWVFRAGFGGSQIWQNGVQRSNSTTAISRVAAGSASSLIIGGEGSTLGDIAQYGPFYMWNRELTRSEIMAVFAEPYAFITPPAPKPIYYIGTAGPATVTGGATLAGTGAVSATGVRTRLGVAALAGTGALSATGVRTRLATASIAGTGTLSTTGVRSRFGLAALTGTGTLSATAQATADPYALTLTLRDLGHSLGLTDSGHSLGIRDHGHTSTIREQH